MFDPIKLEEIHVARNQWDAGLLQPTLARAPERYEQFITTSSEPIERLYTPLDVPNLD